MKTCSICSEQFDVGRVYSSHVRWKHRPITEEYREKLRQSAIRGNEKNHGISERLYLENPSLCINCGNKLSYKFRKHKFCNENPDCNRLKYATGSNVSWLIPSRRERHLIQIKNNVKWNEQLGNFNTSEKQKKYFTSKGENEIKKHFIDKFPEHEWTFGGRLKIKDQSVSRDLYSNKLKICIEYDGIWHFKNIKEQLEKKQLKDRLLKYWCKKNGYRLIRISENYYKQDKKSSILDLEKQVMQRKGKYKELYTAKDISVDPS